MEESKDSGLADSVLSGQGVAAGTGDVIRDELLDELGREPVRQLVRSCGLGGRRGVSDVDRLRVIQRLTESVDDDLLP